MSSTPTATSTNSGNMNPSMQQQGALSQQFQNQPPHGVPQQQVQGNPPSLNLAQLGNLTNQGNLVGALLSVLNTAGANNNPSLLQNLSGLLQQQAADQQQGNLMFNQGTVAPPSASNLTNMYNAPPPTAGGMMQQANNNPMGAMRRQSEPTSLMAGGGGSLDLSQDPRFAGMRQVGGGGGGFSLQGGGTQSQPPQGNLYNDPSSIANSLLARQHLGQPNAMQGSGMYGGTSNAGPAAGMNMAGGGMGSVSMDMNAGMMGNTSQNPPSPSQLGGIPYDSTKRFSVEQIKNVQNLIEKCLKSYMSLEETITHLCRLYSSIEPGFISLMWSKLEQQNPDFFRAYNIRLKIKEQILLFNELVNRQAAVMQSHGVVVHNNTISDGSDPSTPGLIAPSMSTPQPSVGNQQDIGLTLGQMYSPSPNPTNMSLSGYGSGTTQSPLPIQGGGMQVASHAGIVNSFMQGQPPTPHHFNPSTAMPPPQQQLQQGMGNPNQFQEMGDSSDMNKFSQVQTRHKTYGQDINIDVNIEKNKQKEAQANIQGAKSKRRKSSKGGKGQDGQGSQNGNATSPPTATSESQNSENNFTNDQQPGFDGFMSFVKARGEAVDPIKHSLSVIQQHVSPNQPFTSAQQMQVLQQIHRHHTGNEATHGNGDRNHGGSTLDPLSDILGQLPDSENPSNADLHYESSEPSNGVGLENTETDIDQFFRYDN